MIGAVVIDGLMQKKVPFLSWSKTREETMDTPLPTPLLRPYYIANRTREILISNIHLLSPQKWSQFVDFDIEKEFPREQP